MVRYDASAVAKAMADESHHSPRTDFTNFKGCLMTMSLGIPFLKPPTESVVDYFLHPKTKTLQKNSDRAYYIYNGNNFLILTILIKGDVNEKNAACARMPFITGLNSSM